MFDKFDYDIKKNNNTSEYKDIHINNNNNNNNSLDDVDDVINKSTDYFNLLKDMNNEILKNTPKTNKNINYINNKYNDKYIENTTKSNNTKDVFIEDKHNKILDAKCNDNININSEDKKIKLSLNKKNINLVLNNKNNNNKNNLNLFSKKNSNKILPPLKKINK